MKGRVTYSDLSASLKWFIVLGWIAIITWGSFLIGFVVGSS